MQLIIELNSIQFSYQPEDASPVLKDVSFSIQQDEWVAIIGHNGSGKSALAKTISGLLLPAARTIRVGGKELNEANVWDIRRMVGVIFQNPDNQFVGSTAENDVAFGLENQGIPRDKMVERVHDALGRVRMLDFAKREPARLSGGQKQRVAIAGVVALRPGIIILDEATSMLDLEGHAEVIAIIQKIKEESSLTVISITHDIDEVANASHILVMRQEQLTSEGIPEKIFSTGETLVEMGLDLPSPEKLKVALKERGVVVPTNYLTEEGMVDWLWTSVLNK